MNSNMNWGRPAFRGITRPMHPHQPGPGFNPGQRALINVPVESNSHSLHKQNNVVAEVTKVILLNVKVTLVFEEVLGRMY